MRLLALAVIYFPGTVIHEMSHYCAAKLLRIPTGRISLIPRFHDTGLEMGSVQIGRTDFIRRFLVGVAPLVVGITILSFIVYIVLQKVALPVWGYILLGYLFITVLNTMSLSKSDLQGSWKIIPLLVLAIIILLALH